MRDRISNMNLDLEIEEILDLDYYSENNDELIFSYDIISINSVSINVNKKECLLNSSILLKFNYINDNHSVYIITDYLIYKNNKKKLMKKILKKF